MVAKNRGVVFISALALLISPLVNTLLVSTAHAAVNGKIVYEANRGGTKDIFIANADGTGETNLTNDADPDTEPTWSPDGTKIAYTSLRSGSSEIFVMNADGTNLTNITNDSYDDSLPTWSPDSSQLLFIKTYGFNKDIYVINADGANSTALATDPSNEFGAVWSPSGSQIAYIFDDGTSEVYVMDADGSDKTNLTNTGLAIDREVQWSPNGSRLLYTSDEDGDREVYTMNANGTDVVNLTNNTDYDYAATWSPDSSKIAFSSDRSGNFDAFVMDANGTNVVNITNTGNPEYGPFVWSPDGTRLVYTTDSNGDKLVTNNLTGTDQVFIGSPADFDSDYVYWGGWVALASGATSSDSTLISASVDAVLSISTSGTVTIAVTPGTGGRLSSGSDTVLVSTNNATGYTLTFSNQDTTTSLGSGGNTIAAHTGTPASPTALSTNRWGFRVDSLSGFGAGPTGTETNVASSSYTWAGVPSSATPLSLKTTNGPSTNDSSTVWYGVNVDPTQPNGTYSDTVTYTAVTN